jgi:hypothetical protein
VLGLGCVGGGDGGELWNKYGDSLLMIFSNATTAVVLPEELDGLEAMGQSLRRVSDEREPNREFTRILHRDVS